MRATRTPPSNRLRQLLALAALFAQVFVATGAPLPAGVRAAPCNAGPCGCPPPPAGQNCCCTAPKPKPMPVAETCCATAAPKSCCATKTAPEPAKSCCAGEELAPEHAPAVRWVVGAFVQRCRGESLGGVLKFDVSAVAEPQSQPLPVPDPAAPMHTPTPRAISVPTCPPTPPPRSS